MKQSQVIFGEHVSEKRKQYGLTQEKLATAISVRRQYINEVENGITIPSEEKQKLILNVLDSFNPENPIEIIFDYVRIRFPTNSIKHIIEDILRLKIENMLYQDFAFYGYLDQYILGDVTVMGSLDVEKGTLLELKGKGCRQFEVYLEAQNRSWYDFFKEVKEQCGIFKRIDLAINDKFGMLDIKELTRKCYDKECVSVFRSYKSYQSGELIKSNEQHKMEMGLTLYIGSLQSEVYFCLYQKDYEQYIKAGIPVEDASVRNRFEIRLKNERASLAVEDLMNYQDASRTAFGIINRYLRFVDPVEGKKKKDWGLNNQWKWFIGNGDRRLKLTTKPEPYTFERTLRWLEHQVAPTLRVAMELDKINETTKVGDIVKRAKLTERHKKIIKQQTVGVEELIM